MEKLTMIIIAAILIGIGVYSAKGSFPFIYTTIASVLIILEIKHYKKQNKL